MFEAAAPDQLTPEWIMNRIESAAVYLVNTKVSQDTREETRILVGRLRDVLGRLPDPKVL